MSSPTQVNGSDGSSPRSSISTPSRQPNRGSQAPVNGTPSRESPSDKLLHELGRLRIEEHRNFHQRLERQASQWEQRHKEALIAAAREHERVRQSAERAAERFQLELEKSRLSREQQERKDLEEARREIVERELAEKRRQVEEQRRADEHWKKVDDEKKALDEGEARRKAQQRHLEEQEEKRRAERAESERKAREAAQAAEKAGTLQHAQQPVRQSEQQQPTEQGAPVANPLVRSGQTSTPTVPIGLISTIGEREAAHRPYVELHKRLKEMRRNVVDQCKQDPKLKKKIGEMRRQIKASVGQLTGEKGANRVPTSRIREILTEAASTPNPSLDSTPYFIKAPPNPHNQPTQVPGLLLYLLNIFSKVVINQFIDEAGVSPKAADPIGVVAVSIFSLEPLKLHGQHSLVDILLAKLHVVCPVLFGIYGDERTVQGKRRLGWWRNTGTGGFISDQRHSERMTGLGAGFAALTLRDFSKARATNPLPNWHYWRALSTIVNAPAQELTQTHFLLLKAMLDNYVPRFIQFYGQPALVALRKALVDFPAHAAESGKDGPALNALRTLRDTLRRDLHLVL